jgi:enoyl-CoA hydratase/carnithine racemase
MNELSTAFLGTIRNDKLHCVVLSAEGPVFSAGHNLKELVNLNSCKYIKLFKQPHLNFL